MDMITERARAKINLTLHVGGPGDDGYHPLESLVMFAQIGDVLRAIPSDEFSLKIDGPFSQNLETGDGNLILKAARAAQDEFGARPCAFALTKNLPLASGIGGGSADAAAALRAMAKSDGKHPQAYASLALSIGADVPVCMPSETCVMRGIGETLAPISQAQSYPCILINPGVAVSTGEIFKLYDKSEPADLRHTKYRGDLIACALDGRNDLQTAACELQPQIVRVLLELAMQPGVRLSRMSGSGATCFGVFETQDQARAASTAIAQKHPEWWCALTQIGGAA